ncbi:MAG: hypothetical protein KDB02_16245 [Acidimicrobiales bacterium]|nr:hypothetical protein [Acidimicrobiales bacterium]
MTDHLKPSWTPMNDGTGELVASARCGQWAGEGRGYTDGCQLRAFAADARRFPLDPNHPVRIVTGYGSLSEPDDFHATIDVRLIELGHRGQLGACVRLSSFVWPDEPIAGAGSLELVLPTSYQRAAEFAHEIDNLLAVAANEATLGSERFS